MDAAVKSPVLLIVRFPNRVVAPTAPVKVILLLLVDKSKLLLLALSRVLINAIFPPPVVKLTLRFKITAVLKIISPFVVVTFPPKFVLVAVTFKRDNGKL